MNDILKIAWRNVFRNRRRTLLTVSIIIVGISVYIFGLAYLEGTIHTQYERSRKMTGEIRMIHPDFELKSRSFDLSANISVEEANVIQNIDNVDFGTGRIQFGGSIWKGDEDRNALGYGIAEEDVEVFGFDESVYTGDISEFSDGSILVGQSLAGKLGLNAGDELTILTSTQYQSISAQNYRVAGIFKDDNSMLDGMFFITLSDAQYLLDMDGYVTEYAVFLNDLEKAYETKEKILEKVDSYKVQVWDEIGINAIMKSYMGLSRAIFVLIFGTLTSVGILNTMMMVVFERRREIGVLESMGMKKKEVLTLLMTEGILMGIIGTTIGIIVGGALGYYFSVNGIDMGEATKEFMEDYNMGQVFYTRINIQMFIESFIIGIFFALFGSFLPVMPQLRKSPSELLRS